jgi:hypothetical protein
MVNVTIEHIILIPLLFTQIIVFPFVATRISSSWQDSHRDVALEEAAGHLTTTIQQLYLTVNWDDILAGTVTHAPNIPATIDSHPYRVTGSLNIPSDPNATRILTLTLTLEKFKNTVTAVAVLGPNVLWAEESVLQSNSPDASIVAQKFSNDTIGFSFGG